MSRPKTPNSCKRVGREILKTVKKKPGKNRRIYTRRSVSVGRGSSVNIIPNFLPFPLFHSLLFSLPRRVTKTRINKRNHQKGRALARSSINSNGPKQRFQNFDIKKQSNLFYFTSHFRLLGNGVVLCN